MEKCKPSLHNSIDNQCKRVKFTRTKKIKMKSKMKIIPKKCKPCKVYTIPLIINDKV